MPENMHNSHFSTLCQHYCFGGDFAIGKKIYKSKNKLVWPFSGKLEYNEVIQYINFKSGM